LTPELVGDWQLLLATKGSVKTGGSLAPGSIRLARAPLNGAFKFGVVNGLVSTNPVPDVSPPPRQRSKPSHWSPDEARRFLALHEGDRLLPLRSFLLGSGLRIGELVWLQWSRVDRGGYRVRINTFATTLGYEVVESDGKSVEATRTIDIDGHLLQVLDEQREVQAADRLAAGGDYVECDDVFTHPGGGDYHPVDGLRARPPADCHRGWLVLRPWPRRSLTR
jgi:integrase